MVWLSISNIKRGLSALPYYLMEGNEQHAKNLEEAVRGKKIKTSTVQKTNFWGKTVTKDVYERQGGKGYKNFGRTLKKSLLDAEKTGVAAYAKNGGIWGYLKNTIVGLPKEFADAWKAGGSRVPKESGTLAKLAGSFKGVGKKILQKMPVIGNLIWAITALPNIIRATKDGGLASGAAEVAKTIGNMVGFTGGFAIGQALIPIPIVGGIVGGLIGGAISDKILGKSYTEKKAELEQKAMEKAQAQLQQGFDTGSTNPFAHLTPEQQYQLAMMQQQQS